MKKILVIIVLLVLVFANSTQAQSSNTVNNTSTKSLNCLNLKQPLWQGVTDSTTNGEVSLLQVHFLDTYNFNSNSMRVGHYDLATKEAVKSFQRTVGMFNVNSSEADGYGSVGPKTRAMIYDYSCKYPSPDSYQTQLQTQNQVEYSSTRSDEPSEELISFRNFVRGIFYDSELEEVFKERLLMDTVCTSIKDLISEYKKETKINIICKDEKYSFALSYKLNGVGYCADITQRKIDVGKIATKSGIVYCKYPDTDFDEVAEYIDDIKKVLESYKDSGTEYYTEEARNKGKDAAIKANISNARAEAELYFDGNGFSYKGVCAVERNNSVHGIRQSVDAVKDLTKNVACYDYVNSWALVADLVAEKGMKFCVDSSGYAGNSKIKKNGGEAYCVKGR